MPFNLNEDVTIAGRAAVRAPLSFALKPQPRSRVDAGRNENFANDFRRFQPGTATVAARFGDRRSASAAFRADGLNRKNAGRLLNAPAPAAKTAGLRFRPGTRAGTVASRANFATPEPNLFRRALGRLAQVEGNGALHVRAPLNATAASAASENRPEHIAETAEHIAERAKNVADVLKTAADSGAVEPGLPVTVVNAPLFFVVQDFERFGAKFKLRDRLLVAGVAVGMVFHRGFAVRRRNFFLGRRPFDS